MWQGQGQRGGSRAEGLRGWAWPRAVFNQLSSVWFAVAAASCSVFIFSFIILNFNEGPFTAPQSNCLNSNNNYNDDDDDDGGPSMAFAALPQWMLMTAVNVRAMMYCQLYPATPVATQSVIVESNTEIYLPPTRSIRLRWPTTSPRPSLCRGCYQCPVIFLTNLVIHFTSGQLSAHLRV